MVDRQDIDALLIGSLYGELSSTEEARLSAHLESHPADRSALANLSHARDVVRESRILQVQFEPPQSISALLMQEAARRAPKARDEVGWFQRFMRSFMTHPAMAAAAMLVLIIGVAGTVYMRQGDHFANQSKDDSHVTADQAAHEGPAVATPAELAQGKSEQDFAASGSADNYRVQLEDQPKPVDKVVADPSGVDRTGVTERTGATEGLADSKKKNKAGDAVAFERERRNQKKLAKEDNDASSESVAKPPPKTANRPVAKSPPRLDVSTPSQAPKDFENTATRKAEEKLDGNRVASGGGAGASRGVEAKPSEPKPGTPSPPPPPAITSTATVDGRVDEKQKQDPLVAWAKEQHGKVIAAVKAGNCQNAANIAVQISNRAPAYYASNVEPDRTLKNCMSYITAQREKEAERTQRSKSTQRRAADEAPAPSSTSK